MKALVSLLAAAALMLALAGCMDTDGTNNVVDDNVTDYSTMA